MSSTESEWADNAGATANVAYADAIARLCPASGDARSALLPLLLDLQAEFGYIDDAMVPPLAAALNLSRADVHGVVTFYPDLRRSPAGRHVVKLCRAESCQARGGRRIEQLASARLGLAMGETSRDGRVTLEPIYCLGLCATGPNALVDGVPISRIDEHRLVLIIAGVSA